MVFLASINFMKIYKPTRWQKSILDIFGGQADTLPSIFGSEREEFDGALTDPDISLRREEILSVLGDQEVNTDDETEDATTAARETSSSCQQQQSQNEFIKPTNLQLCVSCQVTNWLKILVLFEFYV